MRDEVLEKSEMTVNPILKWKKSDPLIHCFVALSHLERAFGLKGDSGLLCSSGTKPSLGLRQIS